MELWDWGGGILLELKSTDWLADWTPTLDTRKLGAESINDTDRLWNGLDADLSLFFSHVVLFIVVFIFVFSPSVSDVAVDQSFVQQICFHSVVFRVRCFDSLCCSESLGFLRSLSLHLPTVPKRFGCISYRYANCSGCLLLLYMYSNSVAWTLNYVRI